MSPTPAAEFPIDETLIRSLLRAQYPAAAEGPVRIGAEGWDNVIARLGEELLVRIPRRAISAGFVLVETRWLPELAPRLPVPIPAPLFVGGPQSDFPWPWTVVPWLPGRELAAVPVDERGPVAAELGLALRALHAPAPAEAPRSPVRGVRLAARTTRLADALAAVSSGGDEFAVHAPRLRQL